MEKWNLVSTPGLQVTEKDLMTEEQCLRVTGRLPYVAGQRPDPQQPVKELARGMSSPTNVLWSRLNRATRYLVNPRVSNWKFEPSASEARDNELTSTSDL